MDEAELARKSTELERLREEYEAQFRTEPDLGTFDIDDAIARMREALRSGRALEAQTL
jgi:hypothetical protein